MLLGQANAATSARTLSRIENDVETLKGLTNRVDGLTERIIRHARSLGYFEPTPDAKVQPPMPVITTLVDAVSALDRALDHASGALNVFD